MANRLSGAKPEEPTITYRINTGLMWVIVMQMFAIVWWVGTYTAKADQRLTVLENQQGVLKGLPERLARQEQQLTTTNDTLKDIRYELRELRTQKHGGKNE